MNLSDFFSDDYKESFAKRNIALGCSILIKIEELTEDHSKYIIVVGENEDELAIGYVTINSRINENVFPTPYLKSLHVKIKAADHNFLKYDSYADCSSIKIIDKKKLIDHLMQNPDKVVGNIESSTFQTIQGIITASRTISVKEKKRFGYS